MHFTHMTLIVMKFCGPCYRATIPRNLQQHSWPSFVASLEGNPTGISTSVTPNFCSSVAWLLVSQKQNLNNISVLARMKLSSCDLKYVSITLFSKSCNSIPIELFQSSSLFDISELIPRLIGAVYAAEL